MAMATAPARSASRRRGRKAAVCAERRVARVAQQEALQLLQRLQGGCGLGRGGGRLGSGQQGTLIWVFASLWFCFRTQRKHPSY